MGGKPQGDPGGFAVGDKVRYKPGIGTYGYERDLEDDGRIPGEVIGHTPARVRVRLTLTRRSPGSVLLLVKAVDAASLQRG